MASKRSGPSGCAGPDEELKQALKRVRQIWLDVSRQAAADAAADLADEDDDEEDDGDGPFRSADGR